MGLQANGVFWGVKGRYRLYSRLNFNQKLPNRLKTTIKFLDPNINMYIYIYVRFYMYIYVIFVEVVDPVSLICTVNS